MHKLFLKLASKIFSKYYIQCDQHSMNDLYLKLIAYGHSAIVSLERAVDIADRTYLFGRTEQYRLETDEDKDVLL
jgi:hypothetical protein